MLCTHKTASSASLVLEICPKFNNSYLNQFSSISGGNCTSLKSRQDYKTANQDGIALLVIIWSLIHTFEENCKLSDAIMDVKEKFYKFYQGRYMSLERYHELFLAQIEVLDEVGITIEDEALVREVAHQNGREVANEDDTIPSTTPGAEPPRDARDSGSARSHSTHLETSSSDRP